MTDGKLSHLDEQGNARMVDVGDKSDTDRVAVAQGVVKMAPQTLELIRSGKAKKGDVPTVAKVAAIQAAKKTSELIPMCHPIPIVGIEMAFEPDEDIPGIRLQATVRSTGKTGVEMEALTAVSVGLLTIYDMAKAADRGMEIQGVCLLEKRGGQRGTWTRSAETE
jgi:cyclic pyranopterin phosphate synthase